MAADPQLGAISAACNICGGTTFGPGPAGRMTADGKPPHCTQCGSLERHRANRRIFESLPIGFLSWRRGLQFSPDMALSAAWFRSFEISIYGGSNSLDLQRIDRADNTYDFVSLSHVLEFVPDDQASFSEIIRVLDPAGLIHLVLSQPEGRTNSLDFPAATGTHGYFHLYGRDFAERFRLRARELHLLIVASRDPVTGAREVTHFITKSARLLDGIKAALMAATHVNTLFGTGSDHDFELT
jgi:SAM-dependent methyltransferase